MVDLEFWDYFNCRFDKILILFVYKVLKYDNFIFLIIVKTFIEQKSYIYSKRALDWGNKTLFIHVSKTKSGKFACICFEVLKVDKSVAFRWHATVFEKKFTLYKNVQKKLLTATTIYLDNRAVLIVLKILKTMLYNLIKYKNITIVCSHQCYYISYLFVLGWREINVQMLCLKRTIILTKLYLRIFLKSTDEKKMIATNYLTIWKTKGFTK